eukprot:TRINITY_DN98534_c0_g1_i1.p1 TRINITY_DN98534_c0_g1~~TRINITY_DN98534_c0_g1_i1.p1  ORF type:complete len:115 (-),score=22.34 TRINITY_DN98534_c0_g1_i1:89-433(-)
MPTVRVEPKVWFSAERTFIHWMKLSIVFAVSAALLLATSKSTSADICSLIVGIASFAILAHAGRKSYKRFKAFKSGGKQYVPIEDFADRSGAILLATCLTTVVLGMVLIPAFGS